MQKTGSRLQLSVIGSVQVEWDGKTALKGKRKAIALLSYLAVHPAHRAQRGALATLLWQDAPEDKARSSLRQCLAEIRRELPGITDGTLDASTTELGLRMDGVALDMNVALADVARGTVNDALEANPSVANYLFAGLWGVSEEYDSWIREVQARFEANVVADLTALLQSDATPQPTKLRAARLITAIDPLNEEASRAAMQTLAALGEVGAALQTYASLYEKLDDALGMEPSEITQNLAVAIKTGEVGSGVPAVPAKPTVYLPVPDRAAPPRVAVFPFADIGQDPVPRFFLEGILEDTVSLLAQLREMQVYSSNTTRSFPGMAHAPGLHETGLEAEYQVVGTVRHIGNSYRVTVQLVDTQSGLVEWAHTYTAAMEELFDMQSNIAQNIAHQIIPAVTAAELRRTGGSEPADLNAYHLTLRARDIAFALDPATFAQSRAYLLEAQAKDPAFAMSSVALADWYSIYLGQGWSTDPVKDRDGLDQAISQALRLSKESGRALALYAHNQTVLYGSAEPMLDLVDKALVSMPHDAETLIWTVPTLTFAGSETTAAENARKAITLSPHDPYLFRFQHFLSIAEYAAGNYGAAAAAGQYSQRLNPQYTSNLRMTAAALAELGEMDRAREIAGRILNLDPGFRVGKFLEKQPFSNADVGERYAGRLLECGLPR